MRFTKRPKFRRSRIPKTSLTKSLLPAKRSRKVFGVDHTRLILGDIFGEDLHLARVRSLANGVVGVLNARIVSVAAIGRAYAEANQIGRKSGVKQVDRLLSNDGVDMDEVGALWVQHVVGATERIVLALDWTDFDDDDHTTLCASLLTTHGRATPLAWKTVKKSELKNRRTQHELAMVKRLHEWLPETVHVEVLGDRAFGYQQMYALLGTIGWNYTIRFRENIIIHDAEYGRALPAAAHVPANGRAQKLVAPKVTRKRFEVPAIVVVKRKGMKEAWCLATSRADAQASDIIRTYSRRFTIEETFRDTKDITFGLGLRATHIRNAARRDRMLLLIAIAHTLLTLLGAASEASGLDRTLKTNTVKHRTMSLFNQGVCWYRVLDTTREEWFQRLMAAYEEILHQHRFLAEILLFRSEPEYQK
jgi:hypothetical protein